VHEPLVGAVGFLLVRPGAEGRLRRGQEPFGVVGDDSVDGFDQRVERLAAGQTHERLVKSALALASCAGPDHTVGAFSQGLSEGIEHGLVVATGSAPIPAASAADTEHSAFTVTRPRVIPSEGCRDR
jgi:hypothetical protein